MRFDWLRRKNLQPVFASDERDACKSEEQSRLHDPRALLELSFDGNGIVDRIKLAIEDVVSVVGDEGRADGVGAERGLRAERSEEFALASTISPPSSRHFASVITLTQSGNKRRSIG